MLVIEHNLDVIKMADHIIDLGPDGGDGAGSSLHWNPEEVAEHETHTLVSIKELPC